MSGFNEADSWVLSLDQLFSFGPTYHKQTCGLLKNLLHSLKKNVSFDAGRAISEEEIFIIDAQPSSPTFSFSSLGAAVPVVTISDSNPKEKEKEKEKEKTFNPLKSVKSKKEKRKSTHKDLRASIIKSDTEVPFVEEGFFLSFFFPFLIIVSKFGTHTPFITTQTQTTQTQKQQQNKQPQKKKKN